MDGVAADVEMEKTVLPAVILAYDGIAADEAGVVAEVLTNAGTP
ncbi:MAG: hypothetical protein R2710_05415 [Acidimicrobiales bacterium]